jgi:hypothetical protein
LTPGYKGKPEVSQGPTVGFEPWLTPGYKGKQPTQAIVGTPEQIQQLVNMNQQLGNPYEVKGAYLL